MTKGQDTRNSILSIAFNMAGESSLESVAITSLAKATHVSISGLLVHFQSKENLKTAILEFAANDYT